MGGGGGGGAVHAAVLAVISRLVLFKVSVGFG